MLSRDSNMHEVAKNSEETCSTLNLLKQKTSLKMLSHEEILNDTNLVILQKIEIWQTKLEKILYQIYNKQSDSYQYIKLFQNLEQLKVEKLNLSTIQRIIQSTKEGSLLAKHICLPLATNLNYLEFEAGLCDLQQFFLHQEYYLRELSQDQAHWPYL